MCLILDGWISWISWIWIRAGLLGSVPGRRGLDPSPAAGRWRPWRPWRGEALALVLLRHGRFASVSDFRPGCRGQHLISGENWSGSPFQVSGPKQRSTWAPRQFEPIFKALSALASEARSRPTPCLGNYVKLEEKERFLEWCSDLQWWAQNSDGDGHPLWSITFHHVDFWWCLYLSFYLLHHFTSFYICFRAWQSWQVSAAGLDAVAPFDFRLAPGRNRSSEWDNISAAQLEFSKTEHMMG